MLCSHSKMRLISLFIGAALLCSQCTHAADFEDEWASLDDDWVKPDSKFNLGSPQTFVPPTEPAEPSMQRKILPYSMIFFLTLSLVIGIWGARANAQITLAFEEQFCMGPDGILWKQFTRLGKGEATNRKLLVGETASSFKLHARGNPHVDGAVITMTLRKRHELLSGILEWLMGAEDSMCIELSLKDNVIPPMVLAIASKQNDKEMLRRNEDIKELTTELSVDEKVLKDWPSDQLVVFAEHPSYFYDMMSRAMMNQVFGVAAFSKVGRYFRGLQISSDSNSQHKKVMRWWLSVPKAGHMAEIQTLILAVFAMLNQLNDYKISSERRQKAEKVALLHDPHEFLLRLKIGWKQRQK